MIDGAAPSSTMLEFARAVLIHGPVSRTELMQLLDLSPPTMTRLAKQLTASGIFVETAEPAGALGRPAKTLDVRVDARRFLGVKLTGENAVAVATDFRATELRRVERPLPDTSLDSVLDVVAQIRRDLTAPDDAPFTAAGISLGGSVADGRVVRRAPFLGWRDIDLGTPVTELLGIPSIVENDVVALTAAEHWFGRGRGLTDFAVVTIGAGVGHGHVCRDHVVKNDSGLGLAGHIPLDPLGPLCFAGHRGCSTAMLTVPSMCAQAAAMLGRPVSFDELLQRARDGDPVARGILIPAGRALGRLLALVANLDMVDTLVLAGEGLSILEFVEAEMREALDTDRDPEAARVDVRVDPDGFPAWAQGAAAIAIQASIETVLQ